jgi:hypothetical protein
MRFTSRMRNAISYALTSAAAGDGTGDGDIARRNFLAMPDAQDWLASTDGRVVVTLTRAQIAAVIKWANFGIKSTEGDIMRRADDRTQSTAIAAMQRMVEAAGGHHDMYAGMVRHDLRR